MPVAAILLALFAGVPILWLAFAGFLASSGSGGGLGSSMLPTALRETATLMVAVGIVAGTLGLVAAFLVTQFEFPGRRTVEWALMLPIAVPTYLAAYAYTEFLDFTGPVQQALRALTGAETIKEYWFPAIRSFPGAVLVFSLVLYPYVYAACRSYFLMQSGSTGLAARVLGASAWKSFFAITLPLSRPALAVGVTLAMMEVVNDLGAVQYFGINSLTAVIYSTWINRNNFGGAAQLAVTIVLIIGLLIVIEQWGRRNRAYGLNRDSRVPPARVSLGRRAAGFATLFTVGLLGLGFVLPFGTLLVLALRSLGLGPVDFALSAASASISLGLAGALVTLVLGLVAAKLAHPREARASRQAIRLATLGYAIPGTVLALGLLQPLGQVDLFINRITMALAGWKPGLILSGSVAALLYVYAIRFLAVSHSTLEAAMKKRGDTLLDAGRVLGVSGWRLLFRVDLPSLSPALIAAATLVFVEIIKELPATLLLRPLGLETLATVVYGKANAGLFASAALPALLIVVAGLVPVILATRFSDQRRKAG